MSFGELTFVFVFLPFALIPYLILSRTTNSRIKEYWLVLVNAGFYYLSGAQAFMSFLFILLLTYLLGNVVFLYRQTGENGTKWIALSFLLLIGILVYYKYSQRILDLYSRIMGTDSITISVVAPLGISFIIFECVSYVMDIYRGEATPGSFIDMTLFLSLFPKLLSGPIVQWKDFQPQIHRPTDATAEDICKGIDRIIIGYAKKIIIADSFGSMIATINRGIAATGADTQTIWLRCLFYFFQIYYDFSGYSDIAIGICRIYGFELKNNFNYPYISKSISEFWRRWHISLGTWFREYVYIPLGGNRRGNVYLNLFTIFVLTGIWHGLGMHFLLWGAINGLLVVFERAIRDQNWYKKIPNLIKWFATTATVFFLWIIFSSGSLREMADSFSGLFVGKAADELNFTWKYYLTNKMACLLVIAFLGSLAGLLTENRRFLALSNRTSVIIVKRISLVFLFILSVIFMVNKSYSPFMYFGF